MNKVFSADNIVEVGLMRSFLEQHDISSELRNHHSSSLMGEVPFTSVWPEVWVSANDSERAIKLISDIQRDIATGPDWSCSNCHESNPINFDICWQCGKR